MVLIILFGLFLRLHLLLHSYTGFAQPDNYIYYSIAKQTLTNHLSITSTLSGFPSHNPYTEKPLLIYQVLLFSPFLSIYYNMLLLPLLYSVALIFFLFLFARKLSGSSKIGLLGAFLGATSIASLNVTSAMQYRGGSFVPILLLLSLYLLASGIEAYKKHIKLLSIAFCGILFVAMFFLWNGAAYILPVLALSIIGIAFKERLTGSKIIIVMFLLIILASVIMLVIPQGRNLILGALPIGSNNTIAELQSPTLSTFFADFGLLPIFALVGFTYLFKKKVLKSYEVFVLSMVFITGPLAFLAQRWASIFYIPLILLSIIGITALLNLNQEDRLKLIIYLLIALLVIAQLSVALAYFYETKPDTSAHIGKYLGWIDGNTPTNATFLTLWQDGSVIEGWANRQSYTDSVIGQNSTRMAQFSHFLFAKAGNYSYLQKVRPDYLVIHKYWLNYTTGIALEGNLDANMSISGTNFQALENGTFDFPLAYRTANTLIYRIKA